jgi:hypothetical protein
MRWEVRLDYSPIEDLANVVPLSKGKWRYASVAEPKVPFELIATQTPHLATNHTRYLLFIQ